MQDSTLDPWQTQRPWQIVRADLELAHVLMPLSSFIFQPEPNGDGYKIVYTNQGPHPDCFANTVLRPAGSSQIAFAKIAEQPTLPTYDSKSAEIYKTVSRKMASFMAQDGDVQRLEGEIKVPCHAHGARAKDLDPDAVPGHPPFWVKTLIHVYQFSGVVDGDRPIVLFRAPLSPFCPTNGNGTAIGVA